MDIYLGPPEQFLLAVRHVKTEKIEVTKTEMKKKFIHAYLKCKSKYLLR